MSDRSPNDPKPSGWSAFARYVSEWSNATKVLVFVGICTGIGAGVQRAMAQHWSHEPRIASLEVRQIRSDSVSAYLLCSQIERDEGRDPRIACRYVRPDVSRFLPAPSQLVAR